MKRASANLLCLCISVPLHFSFYTCRNHCVAIISFNRMTVLTVEDLKSVIQTWSTHLSELHSTQVSERSNREHV